MGPAPVRAGSVGAVRLARDVVARGAAGEREAAVASARAFCDPSRLVDANAKAGLGQTERGRAAGDSAADDRDIDPAVVLTVGARWDRVFEPVRIQDVER